jgi:LPXTG-site transpeptidase (sortase) family protein
MAARKGALKEIGEQRAAFVVAFLSIFILSLFFLSRVGATPDPIHPAVIDEPQIANPVVVNQAPTSTPEQPVRVIAKDINLDVTVSNPTSVDVNVLDNALLGGAVRYPTSALLGVDGTVLLFGHSSYLPIVHNQAYKTFDGVQNLKPGQIVSVYSADMRYDYSVVQVKVADATQDSVELNPVGKHLTLVTCDSFATKSNRFIVTADFVGAYTLAQ